MQINFVIGQIVHLNSGSPDLKIIAIQDGKVTVEWQSESGIQNATFPAVCLR